MKKHYKPKKVNITKLKSYLKDATTTTNKGHRGSNTGVNATILSITTFTNLEVLLKILLLIVSIVYTVDKWWYNKKNR